ncbi:MAG: DUF1772 domain-containing protein [Microcystaceae cyanobacterium]
MVITAIGNKGVFFMFLEGMFPIIFSLTTLLCSLVAGFLLAFVLVVMPGINRLNDREFIRAFQVIDGIIQNNQPIFVFIWVGSVVFLVLSTVIALVTGKFNGIVHFLIISALIVYIFGVQIPTFTINVPLNNKLQTLDVAQMNDTALKTARLGFEPRWNRWNSIRTPFACLTSALLMILLLQM